MKSYRTLWPYMKQNSLRLLAGMGALVLVDLFQLLIPRVTKHAVDDLSALTADSASLARAGLTIVALAAAIGVFRYFWRRLIIGFSRVVEEDIRNRLYAKVQALPPAWFLTRSSGDIMAHATNDLEAVRMSAGIGLVALFDAILMGAASIGFMIWIDLRLTLVALIPMPLITILTKRLGRVMHRRHGTVQASFGRLTEMVREYLSGIRIIQASVREKMVLDDMDQAGREYVRANISLNKVSGSFFPLMLMFTNLSTAIVLYYGGRLTVFQQISPGDLVAFISYLGLLTWPMMALGWVTNLVQRGAASLDRINSILDQEPSVADPSDPVPLPEGRRGVDIRNLEFAYHPGGPKVFDGLDLQVPAGRVAAVVGRTGSGKTTLLNLIPRLFDPPPGTVFLDGVDVTRLRLSDLRSVIGYVPQDGYVFSGNLKDNIAYGSFEAGDEEIALAARLAEIEEEIRSFPGGFEADVGERGITLSGGQKQRLSLARALLLDPDLLLLDDAFSAVDAAVEEKVLDSLAKIRKGKTTIITSHRLTSLRLADVIYVIEDGRVLESGRHEELVLKGGYFARLYNLQKVQADFNGRNGSDSPRAD